MELQGRLSELMGRNSDLEMGSKESMLVGSGFRWGPGGRCVTAGAAGRRCVASRTHVWGAARQQGACSRRCRAAPLGPQANARHARALTEIKRLVEWAADDPRGSHVFASGRLAQAVRAAAAAAAGAAVSSARRESGDRSGGAAARWRARGGGSLYSDEGAEEGEQEVESEDHAQGRTRLAYSGSASEEDEGLGEEGEEEQDALATRGGGSRCSRARAGPQQASCTGSAAVLRSLGHSPEEGSRSGRGAARSEGGRERHHQCAGAGTASLGSSGGSWRHSDSGSPAAAAAAPALRGGSARRGGLAVSALGLSQEGRQLSVPGQFDLEEFEGAPHSDEEEEQEVEEGYGSEGEEGYSSEEYREEEGAQDDHLGLPDTRDAAAAHHQQQQYQHHQYHHHEPLDAGARARLEQQRQRPGGPAKGLCGGGGGGSGAGAAGAPAGVQRRSSRGDTLYRSDDSLGMGPYV
jgi:hypothetical protein